MVHRVRSSAPVSRISVIAKLYATLSRVGVTALGSCSLCVLVCRDPKSSTDATLVVTPEGHATIEHLYREMRRENAGSGGGF